MKEETRYRWTDAWLLGAIAEASKHEPAQLWQIIAAGELLNRALFTDEEIQSGLTRLTGGDGLPSARGTFQLQISSNERT